MSDTDRATSKRIGNRIRWRVAYSLNHLPGTCWANLVSWALGSRPLLSRDGDDARQDWMCRPTEGCGACYCGKVRAEVSR